MIKKTGSSPRFTFKINTTPRESVNKEGNRGIWVGWQYSIKKKPVEWDFEIDEDEHTLEQVKIVSMAIDYVEQHLEDAIDDALMNLYREATSYAKAEVYKQTGTLFEKGQDGHILLGKGANKYLRNLSNTITKYTSRDREQRLNIIPGRESEYNFTTLSKNYRRELPNWQDAKKIYKRNRSDQNWRKWIKDKYKHFDIDLIEWLSDYPNLSSSLQEEGNLKGLTSEPSDIAIIHAARLCGAPGYSLTVRRLHSIRKDQEASAKK